MKPLHQPTLIVLLLILSALSVSLSTALPTFFKFKFNLSQPQSSSSTSTLPSTLSSPPPQPPALPVESQIKGETVSPHDKQRHREMVKRNVLNWAQIAEMCVDDPDLELCWKLWGFGPGSEKWNTATVVKDLGTRN